VGPAISGCEKIRAGGRNERANDAVADLGPSTAWPPNKRVPWPGRRSSQSQGATSDAVHATTSGAAGSGAPGTKIDGTAVTVFFCGRLGWGRGRQHAGLFHLKITPPLPHRVPVCPQAPPRSGPAAAWLPAVVGGGLVPKNWTRLVTCAKASFSCRSLALRAASSVCCIRSWSVSCTSRRRGSPGYDPRNLGEFRAERQANRGFACLLFAASTARLIASSRLRSWTLACRSSNPGAAGVDLRKPAQNHFAVSPSHIHCGLETPATVR